MKGSCEPRSGQRPVAAGVSQEVAGVVKTEPATPRMTEVCDEDYRCIWRPCEALEEEEGGRPAG